MAAARRGGAAAEDGDDVVEAVGRRGTHNDAVHTASVAETRADA
jgi:hypothetical protein